MSNAALNIGQTFETSTVRVHRYRTVLVVTDLTLAGKRGKKVRQATIQTTFAYKGDEMAWLDRMGAALIERAKDADADAYGAILAFPRDILVDYPGEISISEKELRGVDVEPACERISFEADNANGSIRVRISAHSFSVVRTVVHSGAKGSIKQDTLYSERKKADAVRFYRWAVENADIVRQATTIDHFTAAWRSLGVDFDSH